MHARHLELNATEPAGDTKGRRFHVHAVISTVEDDTTVLAEADATYVLMAPRKR